MLGPHRVALTALAQLCDVAQDVSADPPGDAAEEPLPDLVRRREQWQCKVRPADLARHSANGSLVEAHDVIERLERGEFQLPDVRARPRSLVDLEGGSLTTEAEAINLVPRGADLLDRPP